jgi:hypothetical protein
MQMPTPDKNELTAPSVAHTEGVKALTKPVNAPIEDGWNELYGVTSHSRDLGLKKPFSPV